jgi:hypothetical protein
MRILPAKLVVLTIAASVNEGYRRYAGLKLSASINPLSYQHRRPQWLIQTPKKAYSRVC